MFDTYNSPLIRKSQADLPKTSTDLQNRDFRNWSQQSMYRTTQRDMSKQKPFGLKKAAIPGYQGHVPGFKADNHFGSTYARMTYE